MRFMLRTIYPRGENTSISCIGDQEGEWIPDSSVYKAPAVNTVWTFVGSAGAPNGKSAKIFVFFRNGFRSSNRRRYSASLL